MRKGDLILALTIASIFGLLFLGYKLYLFNMGDERYVNIYIDDELYKSVKLTQETNQEILVTNEYGYNIIKIYNNGVQVTEADCKNQIDVKRGFVDKPGISIICLPHHLEVVIEGDGESDVDGVVS